ncbi:MAG: pilin [Candidatus Saccharibacteria bacterium]
MLGLIAVFIPRTYQFFATACPGGAFFGLPHWYEYLDGETDSLTGKCIPKITNINDFWAIALAAVDILLRIGGMLAVAYVIYGGFRYITSQGESDRTSEAKNTILNAIIGLVIILIAIVAVNFIGATIK